MIDLYLWALDHAGTLFVLGLFVMAGSYIIGAGVMALWTRSEEQRQAEERLRLEALINLSSRPPQAPGLKGSQRKVS